MTDQKKPAAMPEWMRDAIAAEPRGFMQDIIQASRQRSQSASLIPDRQRSQEKPRASSGGTVPIQSPPGLRWVDALIDAQDNLDRANAVRVRADLIEAAMNDKIQYKAKTSYDPFSRDRMGLDDDD